MHLPRLVVAGAHSGAGKTTFSLALMAALTRRGLQVQPYKVGPDYIDPAFHQAATGRVSRNLDSWLLPPETLLRLFYRQAPAADGLSVIEGVMGLFDGQGTGSTGSTAHVASLLEAPVVLLLNGEGMSLSAAALVSGYAGFRPHPDLARARVAAVLINRVSGPAHYAILRQCIEEFTGIPCLGWMPKNAFPPLPSRHLGLIPAGETAGLAEYLDVLAAAAEKTLDIPALAKLAHSAPPLAARKEEPRLLHSTPCPGFSSVSHVPSVPPSPICRPGPPARRIRIGIARDEAFSFYYQDNLDLLEELGARLVPFSPLRDRHLPDSLDGMYLGGGFPEVFAPELEANLELRLRLAEALESGLPAYAECGGMLYLCSTLAVPARDEGACASRAVPERDGGACASRAVPERDGAHIPERHAMVGFFPEQAEMTTRLQPFGYITVTLRRDTLLGPAGTQFRAHEFHYSRLLAPEPAAPPVFEAEKPDGRVWAGGLCKKNVLAMFPHLHFYSCPQAAANFVEKCGQYRNQKDGGA